MDVPTVIARFREAHQLGDVELPLGERLSAALSEHECVANFATDSWEYDIIGLDAGVTIYTYSGGHLFTRHLGRLPGFTWIEQGDFSGDQVNPVKSFDLYHAALPEGHIQIGAHDVTEEQREALRDVLRRLVFTFEEGSLKRFASVDYQLDGTATVFSPNFGSLHEGLFATVTLTPDDKGRVAATLTLSIPFTPSPGPCTCGPRRVDYFDLTLTNLTSGRVYRLDPVSRDFP